MIKSRNCAGLRFGRLVVLASYKGQKYWMVDCLCDCGTAITRQSSNVLSSLTQSCGCLRRETLSRIKFKHGAMRSGQDRWPEHNIWNAMKTRCYNKNCKHYAEYGGRGIKVCERWQEFANFIADMGRRPDQKLTLERLNNDGNYEPSNCVWATRTQQARNRSTTKRLTIDGETMTVFEWAQRGNINYYSLRRRLQLGWHPKDAVFHPLVKSRHASPVH